MVRAGLFLLCLTLFACKGKKKNDKESEFDYEQFSEAFRKVSTYGTSDTALLRNKDTATIRSAEFSKFMSDSLKTKIFGKGTKPKYIALAQTKVSDQTVFYFVKALSGNKRAVLLYVFDNGSFSTVFPFLVPDADPGTSQSSTVDRSFSVTKSVYQRQPAAEGKDVYEYDAASKQFSLILTDPLNKKAGDVINPIDTVSRKHKLAGDYVRDKKNYISVRDGRYPNQLLVFIHIDKNQGECTGELKGDLLLTSATTAIYRQGGDPCIMSFRFTSSSVIISEDEGCGSHRGLDCSFNGSFTKKKIPKPKSTKKGSSK
jgi:hypothetical protein